MKLRTYVYPHAGWWDAVQKMANRMAVSTHKYGHIENNATNDIDYVETLKIRLQKYEDTGNTEWLLDCANFMIIEFLYPKHPNAHFRATDSDESPGLATK